MAFLWYTLVYIGIPANNQINPNHGLGNFPRDPLAVSTWTSASAAHALGLCVLDSECLARSHHLAHRQKQSASNVHITLISGLHRWDNWGEWTLTKNRHAESESAQCKSLAVSRLAWFNFIYIPTPSPRHKPLLWYVYSAAYKPWLKQSYIKQSVFLKPDFARTTCEILQSLNDFDKSWLLSLARASPHCDDCICRKAFALHLLCPFRAVELHGKNWWNRKRTRITGGHCAVVSRCTCVRRNMICRATDVYIYIYIIHIYYTYVYIVWCI